MPGIEPTGFESWVRLLTFVPILACSVVGFGVTLIKWMQLRKSNTPSDLTLHRLREAILARDYGAALRISRDEPTRLSRIVSVLLRHAGRSRDALKDQAARVGARLASELDYGLGGLALIATLGPLFGLFGTVVGIILVFARLAATDGLANPQQLAGGIGTALYTTVAGLLVGILALVFHRYFVSRVDAAVADLEEASLELLDMMSEEPS